MHCRAGIGRTGMVAAAILLRSGLEPMEAFQLFSSKRCVQVPDEQITWLIEKQAIIKD
ncbi:protein-tyrosine phosphatase family protein [Microbulbifer okhotskensis]|uniref:protein-tyrosine phosphatase family protein n=1 Tax=Microbulbifer okhotskensis TaxID=2926617 RepID=UPI00359C838C